MNIMILGSGGIGSYYGTKLLDSGHQITFIARGEHLKAIRQNGLKLNYLEFSFFKKVKALSLKDLEKKYL